MSLATPTLSILASTITSFSVSTSTVGSRTETNFIAWTNNGNDASYNLVWIYCPASSTWAYAQAPSAVACCSSICSDAPVGCRGSTVLSTIGGVTTCTSGNVCRTASYFQNYPPRSGDADAQSQFYCGAPATSDYSYYYRFFSATTVATYTTTIPYTTLTPTVSVAPASIASTSSSSPTGSATQTSIAASIASSSTSSSTSTPTGSDVDNNSGSKAWIAGAVVGPVAGIALLAGIAYFFWRQRKRNADQSSDMSMAYAKAGSPMMSPTMSPSVQGNGMSAFQRGTANTGPMPPTIA